MASFEGAIDDSLWARSASIGASPDEQHTQWREFVLREVARVVNGEAINPQIFDSWPLRKAVRIGAPYATVRWLAERSDITAREYEALRYAVADVDHPQMLDAALGGHAMPRHHSLLLWAALAGNWSVMRAQLDAIPAGDRDAIRTANRIINTCRVPSSNLPLGWTLEEPPRSDYPLLDQMQLLWTRDDADNYPSAEGLDVRTAGLAGPSDIEAASQMPMQEWLPPGSRNPSALEYAESLGALLERRFSDFRLIGAGAYGIVFAAHDKRLHTRVAVKVAVLANPTNQTPARRATHARDELTIMSMIRDSREFYRRHPVSVRLLDWTRGRLDLHAVIDRISTAGNAKRYAPGLGIYQLMEMDAFDVTLLEWQRHQLQRDPARHDPIVTAWFAVLLAQLLTLHRLFGLQHNDIKADNIMLWDLARRPALLHNGYVVDVEITPQRRLRLRPNQVGHAVPTLLDFGLASVSKPSFVGHVSQIGNQDVRRLLGALASSFSPPWVLAALDASIRRPGDMDTSDEIVQIFLAHPELRLLTTTSQ